MENPINMDALLVPPFSGYLHIHAMEKTPFVVDLFKLVIFYCYGSLPV